MWLIQILENTVNVYVVVIQGSQLLCLLRLGKNILLHHPCNCFNQLVVMSKMSFLAVFLRLVGWCSYT